MYYNKLLQNLKFSVIIFGILIVECYVKASSHSQSVKYIQTYNKHKNNNNHLRRDGEQQYNSDLGIK